MNTKQWSWLYGMIKQFILNHQGKIPNGATATDAFDLYCKVMKVSEKSRREDPSIDTQMQDIFRCLFSIIHSLEKEGKEM